MHCKLRNSKKNTYLAIGSSSALTFKTHNVMNMDAMRYRERQAILVFVSVLFGILSNFWGTKDSVNGI